MSTEVKKLVALIRRKEKALTKITESITERSREIVELKTKLREIECESVMWTTLEDRQLILVADDVAGGDWRPMEYFGYLPSSDFPVLCYNPNKQQTGETEPGEIILGFKYGRVPPK